MLVFFGGYGVSEEVSFSNKISCPYCKRLISLQSIKLGAREKCPTCELEFVVSQRLIPREKLPPLTDAGDEYGLRPTAPAETPVANVESEVHKAEGVEGEGEEEMLPMRPMQAPPLELFFKGTFSFPFSVKSRGSLVVLAILCFAMTAMLYSLFSNFGGNDPASKASVMVSMSLALPVGIVLFMVLPAFAIAILTDTAEGFDKFVTMRLNWSFAWLEEPAYLLINLFWATMPASLLLLIMPDIPGMKPPIYVLGETIFFPVFLLSALASRSCVMPYSRAVWRSMVYGWHAWAMFYLLTILMIESFVYFWRVFPHEDFWSGVIILSICLPYIWIVYFRLLGRLALFCSGGRDHA
jgi:hypothetical protein